LGDGEKGGNLMSRIREFADKYNITTNDIKNLTISSLIMKMQQKSSEDDLPLLSNLANMVSVVGLGNKKLQ
jgi:hypothetical protein